MNPNLDECQHHRSVRGVMAHEFAFYQGAQGPEGVRRTVTKYGPVVGGLPIDAWHCEECGLLRLAYPDGRKEERKLHPGPQPGLLAEVSTVAPEHNYYGMQARVSGVSASSALAIQIEHGQTAQLVMPMPVWRLPQWDFQTWSTVVLLAATLVGLLWIAILATVNYAIPDGLTTSIMAVAIFFAVAVLINIITPVWRRWFPMPKLSPSVAKTWRGHKKFGAVTFVLVALLVATIVGLLSVAILATVNYQTPDVESGAVSFTLIVMGVAFVLFLANAVWRRLF